MKKRIIFVLSIAILFNLITNQLFAAECKIPSMPSEEEWQSWIEEAKLLALEAGISKKTINKLNNVKPQSKILLRDRCQVESTITLDEYLYYRLDKARISCWKKYN